MKANISTVIVFVASLLVVSVASPSVSAQGNVNGVCVNTPYSAPCGPSSGSGGGGGSSSNGYGLIGLPFQLIYALVNGIFGGGSNTNAADEALRQQQEQLMMAEVRRRAEEAERLHQEEEARRLAAIYNRLQSTLKLSGLPHLELKTSGIPVGGLQLKLGDSATGANVASNQHVRGFNEGGIPGIQDIYNGGPSPFWPRDKTTTQPPTTSSGLQLKMGDVGPAPPAPVAPISDTGTTDFNKMTPQQLADAADAFSKLPPEEQQRLIAAAQAAPASPQQAPPSPMRGWTATQANDAPAPAPTPITPQTAAQPIAALQQQANASQAAAAAPTLEDASAKARVGFDTAQGSGPVPMGAANPPAALQPSQQLSNPSTGLEVAAYRAPVAQPFTSRQGAPPPVTSAWVKEYLFPGNQPTSPFPSDPNPPLNNPLREEQKQQAELKAWDDWATQQAIHIHESHTEPGQIAYPQGTVQAGLNRSAVQQYAPELLNRYNSDAAFRQSVDLRLQYTDEHIALAYYQGLAEAHKAAILEFHAELDQLTAAGKLDRLTPLDEQYKLHPERRQIVQAAWDRASADEQAALDKAHTDGSAAVDKEYQLAFQLIRGDAAQK